MPSNSSRTCTLYLELVPALDQFAPSNSSRTWTLYLELVRARTIRSIRVIASHFGDIFGCIIFEIHLTLTWPSLSCSSSPHCPLQEPNCTRLSFSLFYSPGVVVVDSCTRSPPLTPSPTTSPSLPGFIAGQVSSVLLTAVVSTTQLYLPDIQ